MTATTDHCDTDAARHALFGHFDGVPDSDGPVLCLCPFCGVFHAGIGKACSNCSVEDTDATRSATERRTGNWFVLRPDSTTGPGFSFDALKELGEQGVVTERSVVRGPSTSQLWRLACKVRGLSREFGQCYNCGTDIQPADTKCSQCNRVQSLPEQVVEKQKPDRRRLPKEDLLTARDVAKAFDLSFGSTDVAALLRVPVGSGTKMRIAIAAGVILAVGALAWPITAAIAGRTGAVVSKNAVAEVPVVSSPSTAAKQIDEEIARSTDAVVPPKPVAVIVPPITIAAVIRPEWTSVPVVIPVRPVVAMVSSSAAANEPASTDGDDPTALFNNGLDAEARGDYRTAVKAYEQIESLPGNEWPANLKTRLILARQGLHGDLR